MLEKRVLQIRESIAVAQKSESESHSLQCFLEARLPVLHHIISLPDKNASNTLLKFVTKYIEHVPDFVEALTDITRSAGIYQYTEQFIHIAEDYFIQPPELATKHSGMHALIDEAYLAHRLMEEVNDRVMMACGQPLSPMDMTLSNIIVHDILGDEFANQLDLAVHYSIEALFETKDFLQNSDFQSYLEQHQLKGWGKEINKWPCLAGDSSISLNLANSILSKNHH